MPFRDHQALIQNKTAEYVGKKANSEGRWAKVSSEHAELSSSPQPHLLFNVADIFIYFHIWT